jgi:hypothetical protein
MSDSPMLKDSDPKNRIRGVKSDRGTWHQLVLDMIEGLGHTSYTVELRDKMPVSFDPTGRESACMMGKGILNC